MKENFDATQFISFDIHENSIQIINEIKMRFGTLGFEVLEEKSIRNVKKEYFKRFRKKVFLELKNKTFIGEIEFWKEGENVPGQIVFEFIKNIEWLYSLDNITNLILIMTAFAEEGDTSNAVISVKKQGILKGLYSMSKYNYDIWVDNIVIQIE